VQTCITVQTCFRCKRQLSVTVGNAGRVGLVAVLNVEMLSKVRM